MRKSIPKEIRQISNLLKRNIEMAHNKKEDITRTQCWVIGFIHSHMDKDIFQKDIEKELNMRRSSASQLITILESKGYIMRQNVSYDKRLKKIVLTPKGVEHQKNLFRFIDEFDAYVARGLSQDELNKFYEILDKIKLNLS